MEFRGRLKMLLEIDRINEDKGKHPCKDGSQRHSPRSQLAEGTEERAVRVLDAIESDIVT